MTTTEAPPPRASGRRELLFVRAGVPLALALLFLGIDLLLHEFGGERWHAATHWLMAALLLAASFIVVTVHQRRIVRRAQARELLAAQEENYRALFDLFPEPYTIWSADGRLLMANQMAGHRFPPGAERNVGRTVVEIFGPAAAASYLEPLRRVYQTGVVEEREERVNVLGIGPRVYWSALQRVETPTYGPAVQVVSYDITQRVAAEDAWREEHARASMYLEIAAVIFVALDPQGRVTLINARGCEILGRDDAGVIGQDWFELCVPERVRAAVRADFQRIMRGEHGVETPYENAVVTSGGEERLIAWQTALARDAAGQVIGTISSGEDITERRHAEEALRASELLRVQERSALEERQRLARELHDSVSQALYGIALGVNTALVLLDRDREATREALDYAIGLARAGLSEMRALIFELRPESLESEGLVAALTKQTDAVRSRFELPVTLQACEEPALPLATKEALYRIAQEALHNAVKHAQARSIGVQLAREPRFLVLRIGDDGIGFDVKEQYPGHLGLKSMHERVDQLGGTLRVLSAPGAGTAVEARVPLEVA